jgi:hypothetical protein
MHYILCLLFLGYAAKIWYFTPIKTSGKVNKGGSLGTSQSLRDTGITADHATSSQGRPREIFQGGVRSF